MKRKSVFSYIIINKENVVTPIKVIIIPKRRIFFLPNNDILLPNLKQIIADTIGSTTKTHPIKNGCNYRSFAKGG